jgi:hypothetical protein
MQVLFFSNIIGVEYMLSTPIFLEKKIQYDTSFGIPQISTVVVPKKQGIYVFLTQNPFFT